MLKHCQSSSVRLQRKYPQNPDTVSLHSNVTTQSTGDSSDSSLNSSFNMNHHLEVFNVRNAQFDRSLYLCPTPDPISLSSRTSSYTSLAETGPKTPIKVFASCLRPDIEYKTISVGISTTAKDVIWQLLSKFRMKHRDPKLFFLTMEVVIQKPGRDGLTKKTLVLEDDSKPAELKNCNPWGECRFMLQMRKGGLVKVYDSILMEESQYKCLLISDETSVDDVIKILLFCYGLEKVERSDRYCMYEQCSSQRYERRLVSEDKPLCIQALWPGPTPFSFVLRRSPLRIEDNVWNKERMNKLGDKMSMMKVHGEPRLRSYPAISEWSTQTCDRLSSISERGSLARTKSAGNRLQISSERKLSLSSSDERDNSKHRIYKPTPKTLSRFQPLQTPNFSRIQRDEEDSWPELDKDSEEHVSSGEDMDTSLSSNDSPTPPLTSTPLCANTRPFSSRPPDQHLSAPKPTMSFLYPSPDYESFPHKSVPSRPYSSLSSSSVSLSHTTMAPAPSLPPKPASLASLFSRESSESGGFHDYENYFYI